jgi:putative sigma-54 modulation protein
MRLHLAARRVELSLELQDFIKRPVQFGLGRFANKINCLSMRLADVNGTRGGVDKCCDVQIDAGLNRPIVVRERQDSVHAAIAFALHRAELAISRHLQLANPKNRL